MPFVIITSAMLAEVVTPGWKLYSSIKCAGFGFAALANATCMKNQDTLIEQSLQNKDPNRQIVQSCIST